MSAKVTDHPRAANVAKARPEVRSSKAKPLEGAIDAAILKGTKKPRSIDPYALTVTRATEPSSYQGIRRRKFVPSPQTRRLHSEALRETLELYFEDVWRDFADSCNVSSYHCLYDLASIELVPIIRKGLPAEVVPATAHDMGVSKETLFHWLGMARSTTNRKVLEKNVLSPDASEKILGLQKLVGLVESIMEESGTASDFNAAHWVAQWLEMPLPAFGNKKPSEYMDTLTGQEMVARALARMQSGAYA